MLFGARQTYQHRGCPDLALKRREIPEKGHFHFCISEMKSRGCVFHPLRFINEKRLSIHRGNKAAELSTPNAPGSRSTSSRSRATSVPPSISRAKRILKFFPRVGLFSHHLGVQHEKYLTSAEVRQRLRFKSKSGFWAFVHTNNFPLTRLSSKTILFPESAVRHFLMARTPSIARPKCGDPDNPI